MHNSQDRSGTTGAGDRLVVIKHSPFNAETPPAALESEITPTANFYVRSNFAVPALDPEGWRLRVGGMVDAAYEIGLADIARMEARELTSTMECAGNNRTAMRPLPRGEPWGGGAVATARWRGVPLRPLLEKAGLQLSAVEVVFRGADRGRVEGVGEPVSFERSLPLERALDPDTLLVFEMNGEPLPAEHGGPVRLVVPGWYGMASVKWLAEIEAVGRPFEGFFQKQRYVIEGADRAEQTPVREMLVKCLVTSLTSGALLTMGPSTISGYAWSGSGRITRVEVSVEGEGAWQPARLMGEASRYGWQRWEFDWTPERPGRYALRARAEDEQGNVQPDAAPWNRLGYANNSIQPMLVQVAEPEP